MRCLLLFLRFSDIINIYIKEKEISFEVARDNVERLLHKFLPLKLANFHNISYLFSDYDCVKYELDDKVICVAHGQYDKISTAIENFVKLRIRNEE